MTRIIHMRPADNPKARWLIQEDNELYVGSECCQYKIDSQFTRPGDHWSSPPWARCLNCNELLEFNQDHWKGRLQKIERLSVDARSGGTYWNDWGQYWFGLPDLGIKVEIE